MNYNVCIIKPDGYDRALAFVELGELIHFSLKQLGFEATLNFNQLANNCRNILIGCHLFDVNRISSFPDSTIVLNTEQLFADTVDWNTSWSSGILQWAKRFEVWDYSVRNIAKFSELGIQNVRHLKLGFQKELVRIEKPPQQDIDVLFYGIPNDRRLKILNELKERGYTVLAVAGAYGKERDALIARSKVVLNYHFHNSQIFEIVRVFYLLTNSKAVVSEVNETTSIDPIYLDGIYPSPYDGLVDSCAMVIEDGNLRESLEQKAFDTISRLPQSQFTANVISAASS